MNTNAYPCKNDCADYEKLTAHPCAIYIYDISTILYYHQNHNLAVYIDLIFGSININDNQGLCTSYTIVGKIKSKTCYIWYIDLSN